MSKTLEERIKIMEHYRDGGKISHDGQVWIRGRDTDLSFNAGMGNHFPYEIHEEPKSRPWTWEELMEHADDWFVGKKGSIARRITDVCHRTEKVILNQNWYTAWEFCKLFDLIVDIRNGSTEPCEIEISEDK